MSKIKTTISIKCPDDFSKSALCRLFDSIADWVKTMHPDIIETDNDQIGRYYLKSIALHSDAIPNVEAISTYGYINKWTFLPSRSELEIKQTTFDWQEAVKMWDLIAQKYIPGAIVTYKSACESGNDFSTNIAEYADTYVVKTKDTYIENASKETVEELLSKRYKGSFKEMYSSYMSKRPSCMSISKWDIVPISETI